MTNRFFLVFLASEEGLLVIFHNQRTREALSEIQIGEEIKADMIVIAKGAKRLFITANLLFLLSGLGLIGFAIWMQSESSYYDAIYEPNQVTAPAMFLIAVGSVIILVSLLGFYGVYRKSEFLLLLYLGLLILTTLIEIVSVVVAFALKGKMEDSRTEFSNAISKVYGEKGQETVTASIDHIQKKMRCCGAYSSKDYIGSKWLNMAQNRTVLFPPSCTDVSKQQEGSKFSKTSKAVVYDKGCINVIEKLVLSYLVFSCAMAALVLFFEALSIAAVSSLRTKDAPSTQEDIIMETQD